MAKKPIPPFYDVLSRRLLKFVNPSKYRSNANYFDLLNDDPLVALAADNDTKISLIKATSSDTVSLVNGAVIPTGKTLTITDGAGALFMPGAVQAVHNVVTLAEVNAGKTIIAAVAGKTIIVWYFRALSTGAFAALTDIRLSDTAGTPVDVATLAQAQLTNGAILTSHGGTGVTIGTLGAALTAAAGLQVRKTGSTATTATSITFDVLYSIS